MHVPDGFLDAPTSVATGVLAAGTVALALRKAREELDERTAPLAPKKMIAGKTKMMQSAS